jgi:four helix bundle protein
MFKKYLIMNGDVFMSDNVIQDKTYKFAIKIVSLYKYLCENKKEYILSKQLLRSGTSIGANVKESINAQSRKDFISKFSIALKEVSETEYWIELLMATDYLDEDKASSMLNELNEIDKIITSIIITNKASMNIN